MGYTHYWRRPKEIGKKDFLRIVDDFKKVLPKIKEVVSLAGPLGKGKPIINEEKVLFNGSEDCGHPENSEIVIPWPSKDASGIASPFEDAKSGNWFTGVEVSKRCCGGDCSYETFAFERIYKPCGNWDKPEVGKYFNFCKTGFRPYDLAVITFLIIAKHHLNGKLIIESDGLDQHWFDGNLLCQMELGYGLEMKLNQEGALQEVKGSKPRSAANWSTGNARKERKNVRKKRLQGNHSL